jgi:hypothetical protein
VIELGVRSELYLTLRDEGWLGDTSRPTRNGGELVPGVHRSRTMPNGFEPKPDSGRVTSMKYLTVILAAVAASIVTVLVLKSAGIESAGLIGGGVGGGIAGFVASKVFRNS